VFVSGGEAEASSPRDRDAPRSSVFAESSLSDVGAGAGAATCINSGVPSSERHAANQNPGIVSAGLGTRGPEGGAAKSKSTGVPQPRAESKVDRLL